MIQTIQKFMKKPELYAPGTAKFWDDEHISKGMLQAHLAPTLDSATRNHTFVGQSVDFISSVAPPRHYPHLLDLGCGPGIYAERFDTAGYRVTGIDLSERSVDYARQSARKNSREITYRVGDYLALDVCGQFDVVTLIYCDFGVLPTESRTRLLYHINTALRPGGLLIFDVFTPFQYSGKPEYRSWECSENGFWKAVPHLCLTSFHRYEDQHTFLTQYIVATEDNIDCYNIWEHTFTKDELQQDLTRSGFRIMRICGDIAGGPAACDGKQMCIIAEKCGA